MPKTYLLLSSLIMTLLLLGSSSARAENTGKFEKIEKLYKEHENICLEKGWSRINVTINGQERRILWKEPAGGQTRGAIIVLHGGGGTYSNACSGLRIGRPMVDFTELALAEGFALFSPDSLRDGMKDDQGRVCGKRWISLEQVNKENADLKFIETILRDIIPSKRKAGDSTNIFVTGISNGGFMTILAATHLGEYITAFAAVSAGDPYGFDLDCDESKTMRKNAPGMWYDRDTRMMIGERDACVSDAYPQEKKWPEKPASTKPPFKQFHHKGDSAVDLSCMKKIQGLLVRNGYRNAGEHVASGWGIKSIWNHFWLDEYNAPLIEFFKTATP